MKTPEEIKYGLASHGYEICDKRCAYHDFRGTGYDCSSMLCQDAHTYIEKLESQIPRWIPVEERLPKALRHYYGECSFSDDVLVYDGVRVRVAYYCNTTTWWHDGRDEDDIIDVTHWMPLPEPPIKEEHTND